VTDPHPKRPTIARVFIAGLLVALLAPLATYPLRAAQHSLALSPGDQLTITCETRLSASVESSKSIISCAPPSRSPAPLIESIQGVREGQALRGIVAIEVVPADVEIAQVVFHIHGPQSLQHSERHGPYLFLGDSGGEPRGWDTRTAPDGAYTLIVTATSRTGQNDTWQRNFTVANGRAPQPHSAGAPEPTQAPRSTQVPLPTQLPPPTQVSRSTGDGATFRETFDGTPARPQPWQPATWDVTVHSRARSSWYELPAIHAGHGNDCSAPPNNHLISAYEDAVFICRDHVMTAIDGAGYGTIVLTPNQLVDFSDGEAVVRFDVSTLRTSSRDWIELWLTPYDENLQLPTGHTVDLNGPPRNAVRIAMTRNDSGGFNTSVYRNFESQKIEEGGNADAYEEFLTPSATRRDTFELRISRTHIAFGMPAYDKWWVDSKIPALGWSQAVVQLGHYSYTPGKGCDTCGPNTWHWDNVEIQPAVPFTLVRAHERYADRESPQVRLARAAPANGRLRFAGIGTSLEVSFDGGATWQAAQPQQQVDFGVSTFGTYWTPIPAGSTQVWFRGEGWWGGDWHVRDISVWSRNS
jgi:hypothetical protein